MRICPHLYRIRYFNPRSPRGERLWGDYYIDCYINISIHAPLAGSDVVRVRTVRDFVISIHAPLAGSDKSVYIVNDISCNFNPRSPRGERRCLQRTPVCLFYFNPRSPRGERLVCRQAYRRHIIFQSTLPSRGATSAIRRLSFRGCYFNPRSPRGERQNPASRQCLHYDFNPRSPRGERRAPACRS